jgi:iron-sulfur cluster repair protein YtfE (RIC family)
MNHVCRCSTHTQSSKSATRVTPEQTVAEVSRRPGALEVLERLGINHCCGAHLSLREAAAAAGINLDELLRALDEPASAPA